MIYWPNTLNAKAQSGLVFPLTHARILWQSVATSASATAETDGFDADYVLEPDTYSWWIPGAAATITLSFSSQVIDCIGIAAHTIGSSGRTATIEAYTGGAWVNVLDDNPAPDDDFAIMAHFPAITATQIRITVSGDCRIGVIYVGQALAMMRPAYANMAPVSMAEETNILTSESVTGQWLGTTYENIARPLTLAWQNLPEAWVYEYVEPWLRNIKNQPYFVAQRPAGYPRDVAYCMGPMSKPTPERQGRRDFMSLSFDTRGHY